MRFCGRTDPGNGVGKVTGQPLCFAKAGSSPARYFTFGALARAVAPVALENALATLREAVLFPPPPSPSGAAGASPAFCAVSAADAWLALLSVQPAMLTTRARAVKSND